MTQKKPTGKGAQDPAKSGAARGNAPNRFTADERAAMKERARELKAGKTDGKGALLAKIAEMPAADSAVAERVHAIITASAPGRSPKTWYGMPAYAKDDHVVCFFQSAQKFKARHSTLGFSEEANLDEGRIGRPPLR